MTKTEKRNKALLATAVTVAQIPNFLLQFYLFQKSGYYQKLCY